jgi:diguanylate cyclase (GGDEF)-like protein/PAS domain S-box-containing protein
MSEDATRRASRHRGDASPDGSKGPTGSVLSIKGSDHRREAANQDAILRPDLEGHVGVDLQRYLRAIESRIDAVAIADHTGAVRHVNRAFEALTGYARDEVLGRHVHFITNGERGPEHFARVVEQLRNGCEVHGLHVGFQRSGAKFHAEESVRPFVDADGCITHYVFTQRDASARVAAARQLEHLAHHDHLTGLPNRVLFGDRLGRELARATRNGTGLALLCLDLDGMKSVNDEHGHVAGDELLRAVARRLEGCLRKEDTVARLGGDEFAVIVAGTIRREDVVAVLDKVHPAVGGEILIDGSRATTSLSIGIARFPFDGSEQRGLLWAADHAMYRAKRAGGNRYCFADDRPLGEGAPAQASGRSLTGRSDQ